jgi:hypothetical protein
MLLGAGQLLLLGCVSVTSITTAWTSIDGPAALTAVSGAVTASIGLLLLESIVETTAVGHGAVLLAMLCQIYAAFVHVRADTGGLGTPEQS